MTSSPPLVSELLTERAALSALARAAEAAGLAPHQMEHDLEWLACTDHGTGSTPGALALRRGGRLVGYVPLRRRSFPLHLRAGEISLVKLPIRAVQLFGRVLVGDEDGLAEAALDALSRLSLPFDLATLEELPLDCPIAQAIGGGRSAGLSVVERARGPHWLVDLPKSPEEILGRFSSKTRSTFGRKARKLEKEVGPLWLRVHAKPEEQLPFLKTVEAVARKTYHYRLLGRRITSDNDELRRNLEAWATRGWVRAYVLGAGERCLAYVICYRVGRRFFYEIPGYDPDLASHSPGNVLLVKLLEELVGSGLADELDFGAGDADYKRLFGTRSFDEASFFLVRRRLYAQGAVRAERAFAWGSRQAVHALDRLGVKAKLKSIIRHSLGRGRGGPAPVVTDSAAADDRPASRPDDAEPRSA